MTTQNPDQKPALETRLDELNQFKIDLGLERIATVLSRLELDGLGRQIITVGGTNGKGSTVAALCALLSEQNKSVGAFTSPHIFAFNERINIKGQAANDEDILQAFTVIDEAKQDIHLSYFEYAFLAAMWLFKSHDVDVIILEVGLGGRLDATNSIDADAAIITTVDLDHTEWLGNDIESIAYEKAGIMRPKQPVVYGDIDTPDAIINHASRCQAKLSQYSLDYQLEFDDQFFSYKNKENSFKNLLRPQLKGDWQLKNFCSALTVLLELEYMFDQTKLQRSLASWHINGRLQTMQEHPWVLADVAHNKQAVLQLVSWLKDNPIAGQTRAVFSVLADKQFESWIGLLDEVIDHWFVFQLEGVRAMKLADLKMKLADHVSLFSQFNAAKIAYEAALSVSKPEDRIIVFGSFHVLDAVFK
ncbi:MAG: bifunctional folylpolyglutamate synthase/dihydrofolate synthase [Marinicella sp.]